MEQNNNNPQFQSPTRLSRDENKSLRSGGNSIRVPDRVSRNDLIADTGGARATSIRSTRQSDEPDQYDIPDAPLIPQQNPSGSGDEETTTSGRAPRIDGVSQFILVGAAWAIYGVDFLINIIGDWFGAGEIISIFFMLFAYACIILAFRFKGVNVFERRYIMQFGIRFIMGEIPILDALPIDPFESEIPEPSIVAAVKATIRISREEDGIQS